MFLLGAKAIKRLASEQANLAFFQAKLTPAMFKGEDEVKIFNFAIEHFKQFHVLPSVETLTEKFPLVKDLDTPEPAKYYLNEIDLRYGYDLVNRSSAAAREVLKNNPKAVEEAFKIYSQANGEWLMQKNRMKVMDIGQEAPEYLLKNYYGYLLGDDNSPAYFGWPYLDELGGVLAGEVVSFVGRPAVGKTYKMLYCALHNWGVRKENVLFCSPEMGIHPITQRIGAMYSNTPINQLKIGGFSNETFDVFEASLVNMKKEPAKFYVIDANMAANVEEIFALAAILGCRRVFIDGAYLLKHPNKRLDRFTKVAENIEWIKMLTSDHKFITFCSWQFNRDSVKKMEKKKGSKPGTEDIGYSDAIGQISSIIIAIMQDDGVETIIKRDLDLIKGRNGEVGKFSIHWDFDTMNFTQFGLNEEDQKKANQETLEFV